MILRAGLVAALALGGPGAALAEGLMGRTVLFRTLTFDDPKAPIYVGLDYAGTVGPGPEFGMVREFRDPFYDVVPVLIDVSEDRIVFTYDSAGTFSTAEFNGYVLEFPTTCTLITDAAIDRDATTLPLAEDALTITPQSLNLNVSGLDFAPGMRIEVQLDVADCPMS